MKLEMRNDGTLHIEGYVNAVDRYSKAIRGTKGSFIEKVKPQVFKRAIEKAKNIDMLFNHNESKKLASTGEGTLKLTEDAIGLRAEADVKDADVIREARAGHLKGWSFGFTTNADTWEEKDGEVSKRTLEDINLLEVSLLTITPAYIGTSVQVRSLESEVRSLEDEQETLNDSTEAEEKRAEEVQKLKDWTLLHENV